MPPPPPRNPTRNNIPVYQGASIDQPKFPFSSPISAEVSTPPSSATDRYPSKYTPPQPSKTFTDESDDTSGQDDFGLERYTLGGSYKPWKGSGRQRSTSSRNHRRSVSMTEAAEEMSKRDKEETKKRRPGLNVVTNFSKGSSRAWTDGQPPTQQAPTHSGQASRSRSDANVSLGHPPQNNPAPAFVNLDDLKSLAKASKQNKGRAEAKNKPAEKQGRFLSPEQRKAVGAEMNPSKGSDLSPSDRPIVIGITIPSQELVDQKAQPNEQSAKSDGTPATPAIVVTPAKEEDSWPHLDQNPDEQDRRPTSSIYSQSTPYVGGSTHSCDVPPVPAIPQKHAQDPSGLDPSRRKERGMSTDTFFEEDDSPQFISRARSDSDGSQEGILRRPSLDKPTGRPNSKGWWNLMLSPLLTRSNTLASRKSPVSPTQGSDLPAVPSLAAAAKIVADEAKDRKIESPKSSDSGKGHRRGDSIWNDLGDWEQKREEKEKGANTPTQEPSHKTQDSSETIPFMIASPAKEGSAAEYYQACAHDLVNPVPFFQCQNHSCALESKYRRVVPDSTVVGDGNGFKEAPEPEPEPSADGVTKNEGRNSNNPFFQKPSNRFSAAFKENMYNRGRPDSVSTVIEDEPELSPEMSPNVREANAAPILRAKPLARAAPTLAPVPEPAPTDQPVDSAERELAPTTPPAPPVSSATRKETTKPPSIPPPYSPPHKLARFPKYVAIMPPDRQPPVQEAVASPGPVSPNTQEAMSSRGAIQMSDMQDPRPAPLPPQPYTVNNHYYAGGLPPRPKPKPVVVDAVEPEQAARNEIENQRQRLEKEDAVGKKLGGLWRGRGCIPERGCFGRSGREGRNRRRWYFVIGSALLTVIVVAIVLATTLTRNGDDTPIQSQFLNLTGFPPMPTGISTIARPDVQVANSGCVHPSTLWSCALPKEQQESIAPNDPDQPNFRFEIRFRNGTIPDINGTSPNMVNSTLTKRSVSYEDRYGGLARRRPLVARDPFTDDLYTSSPSPPSLQDQNFLGNTTDNITTPFAGEETPFYITFLSTTALNQNRLSKRQNISEVNATDPDITDAIPSPDVNPDGTAAAANLLPFPSSQPVRLYNRGQASEHYGFYTYYDRSIFLKSTALLNSSSEGEVPDDENGGSLESAANVRCTWAQTRFLVQIWTQAASNNMALLQNSNISSSPTSTPTPTGLSPTSTSTPADNSAVDFARPGSLPYPVTITLDRHGGDIGKKMVYCYGMDDRGQIVSSEKKFQPEFRGFGGNLINPAQSFEDVKVSLEDGGPGGIDGGTGGCGCQWINWVGTG